jgi:predicted AlkP superfamily pyrophosphatase or phosphodiesterase
MRILSISANGSRVFATSIVALFVVLAAFPAFAGPGSGGRNAADRLDSSYLILISIDGFRWDYPSLYDTPALDRLARGGVRAESLRPVYPTLTFPNHYSIATGLHPAEHGIIHNHFPNGKRSAWYHLWDRSSVEDGSWYSGVPIWVAAEKAGMVSAAYYFVGTEAAIGEVSPSHWYSFDESVPAGARVAQVIDWLRLPAEERPHMITLYFEDVDDAGHDYGEGSAELAEAVALVDASIGRLLDAIDDLGLRDDVHLLIVSDHGQADHAGPDSALVLNEHIDLDGLEIIEGGSYASIYQQVPDKARAAEIRDAINSNWSHGRAYLRDETPADWRVSDDSRFPDIFVAPELHHAVVSSSDRRRRLKHGDHGWEPRYRNMHGVFIASGPRVIAGQEVAEISAVDVYPLMLELLQIADQEDRDYVLRRVIATDE